MNQAQDLFLRRSFLCTSEDMIQYGIRSLELGLISCQQQRHPGLANAATERMAPANACALRVRACAFKAATASQGENMTDVLLGFIEEYVRRHPTTAVKAAKKGRRS